MYSTSTKRIDFDSSRYSVNQSRVDLKQGPLNRSHSQFFRKIAVKPNGFLFAPNNAFESQQKRVLFQEKKDNVDKEDKLLRELFLSRLLNIILDKKSSGKKFSF